MGVEEAIFWNPPNGAGVAPAVEVLAGAGVEEKENPTLGAGVELVVVAPKLKETPLVLGAGAGVPPKLNPPPPF